MPHPDIGLDVNDVGLLLDLTEINEFSRSADDHAGGEVTASMHNKTLVPLIETVIVETERSLRWRRGQLADAENIVRRLRDRIMKDENRLCVIKANLDHVRRT